MDGYDAKDFAKQLMLRGLMTDREQIREYIRRHRKERYTEDDLESAYHEANAGFVSKRKWWIKEAPDVMVWDDDFKGEVIRE